MVRHRVSGEGLLITFEGGDGSGKSTQARLLADYLVERGYPIGPLASPGEVLREPGGTAVGEAIRELLLHGDDPGSRTEALLYAAARAELVERVLVPELRQGRILIIDRYVDSSLAYQGWARGLGIDEVMAINEFAVGGLMPDLTFLLRLEPRVAAGRAGGGRRDRIEAEGVALQRRVVDGYAQVAARWPQRLRVIDGGRPPKVVLAEIAALTEALLAATGEAVDG